MLRNPRLCLTFSLLLPLASLAAAQPPPFQARDIDREYNRLLQQLAEGTSPGVVAVRLRRMEDVCFDQKWDRTLFKVQEELAARIEASCGPVCLLPMVRLHQELVLEYLDRLGLEDGEPPLRARRALTHLEKIERLHREQDKSEAGAWARADLSAAFGASYRDRGMVENARLRFQEALRDHPEHREALHLLASLEEKMGLYGAARPPLEQLVAIAPEDAIARLRLAMVDARTGREEEAADQLDALIGDPSLDDWVRRVAFHRLARLRSALRGRDAARDVLLGGLREFPFDQPMQIALAYYTEDLDASRGILETLAATPRPAGLESARGRYNNWPSTEVAELPRRLQQTLEAANAHLLEAVAAVRGPEMLP
jgi:tetratricopeptide (TPR) repeat protein